MASGGGYDVLVVDPRAPAITGRIALPEQAPYLARPARMTLVGSQAWTPLLRMADRGEKPLDGALLVARHGKGDFVDRRNDPARDAWEKYDFIVDEAERLGLELIVRIDRAPQWARPNDFADPKFQAGLQESFAGLVTDPDDDNYLPLVLQTQSRLVRARIDNSLAADARMPKATDAPVADPSGTVAGFADATGRLVEPTLEDVFVNLVARAQN